MNMAAGTRGSSLTTTAALRSSWPIIGQEFSQQRKTFRRWLVILTHSRRRLVLSGFELVKSANVTVGHHCPPNRLLETSLKFDLAADLSSTALNLS